MRRLHWLAATTFLAAALPTAAAAQAAPADASQATTPGDAQATPDTSAQTPSAQPNGLTGSDIVVTARQRQERLQDVPVAVTAVTGDFLRDQQVNTVRDIAAYSPGLNINSDSAGRAFVSIRGIGTTLIDSVQPGVGIFVDGVYQPNTSYLNLPIVDVARIEVLRGPQGTLFGNNTLGGAINVITRQPSNEWHGRLDASAASPDNFYTGAASLSGPIVRDLIQFRVAGAIHVQDNFQKNSLIGGNRNPLDQRSANGTLRFTPADWATITFNGSCDRVFGGSVPYANVAGPSDYTRNLPTNVASFVTIKYQDYNVKGEFNVAPLHTRVTLIGAINYSEAHQPTGDGDFGPIDFLRASTNRILRTNTAEIRFDTQWSDNFSTLIGAFGSISKTDTYGTTLLNIGPPVGFLAIPSEVFGRDTSQAVFGTAFLKFNPTLDLAVGLRYDHQRVSATSATTAPVYTANQVQPRITLTKRWDPDFMTYASIARGVRGGGQNNPGAPNLIYGGDSVWTYELGTKFQALDRHLSVEADVFYNDYSNFIGPNALAPSTTGAGFVAVNLNSGQVKSYGAELEASYTPNTLLRLYGNITLLHARVTDATEFRQTTGYDYAGDRIPFVPALNFTVGATDRVPLGGSDHLLLDANVIYKGRRQADSLDATRVPFLAPYALVNGSIGWQHAGFELAVFTTNLFNSKYLESYLDSSLLSRAGLPAPLAQNLGILGQRRRVGVRASFRF